MNCRELEPELVAYAKGECSPAVRDAAAGHLEECAACRARFGSVKAAFIAAGDAPAVSAGFADAVMSAIEVEPLPAEPAAGFDWTAWILPALTAAALATAGFYFYRAASQSGSPASPAPAATESQAPLSEGIPPYALGGGCLDANCSRTEGAR
jgi:anti-sigma factor RsiW